jgi:rRNA maturation RNase YbeY
MTNYTYNSEVVELEEEKYTEWLVVVIESEGSLVGEINFIISDDETLLSMNKEYLNHDYYTDVITFDYSSGKEISGDIFISWDRVKENADLFSVEKYDELRRVMVHGILHLLGYKDKTGQEKSIMRELEDSKLKMFHVEHR